MVSEVSEGTQAPDFDLPGDGGESIRLSELRGKTVVLYFYPKDDTSGCTKEAIEFTDLAADFKKAGAVVIGVSPDPATRHDKFKAKYDLAVRLASDEDKSTLQAYGVWTEKSMYGRTYMGVERSTFLIDGTGTVRKVWRKVRVAGHAKEVLAAVQAL
jgi:thioredoxin-dependent peroxiredoxin